YVGLDPLDQPESSAVFPVQDVNLAMLLAQIRHRHAAGDLQTVRVIGDGAERVPTGQTLLDDVGERLAAIAPRGVHLKIAAIVLEARTDKFPVLQCRHHLRTAEELTAKIPAMFDVGGLSAVGDG